MTSDFIHLLFLVSIYDILSKVFTENFIKLNGFLNISELPVRKKGETSTSSQLSYECYLLEIKILYSLPKVCETINEKQ